MAYVSSSQSEYRLLPSDRIGRWVRINAFGVIVTLKTKRLRATKRLKSELYHGLNHDGQVGLLWAGQSDERSSSAHFSNTVPMLEVPPTDYRKLSGVSCGRIRTRSEEHLVVFRTYDYLLSIFGLSLRNSRSKVRWQLSNRLLRTRVPCRMRQ